MHRISSIFVVACVLALSLNGTDSAKKAYRRSASLTDQVLQDCILKDINCPTDGSLDYKRGRIVYKIVRILDLPDRCSCDLNTNECLRGCFYNYLVKSSVLSAAWRALATGGDAEDAKRVAVQTTETHYKPCLFEGKDCEQVGIKLEDTAELTATLAKFRILVDSPADCECDLEEDSCARRCFYSYTKKYLDANISMDLVGN